MRSMTEIGTNWSELLALAESDTLSMRKDGVLRSIAEVDGVLDSLAAQPRSGEGARDGGLGATIGRLCKVLDHDAGDIRRAVAMRHTLAHEADAEVTKAQAVHAVTASRSFLAALGEWVLSRAGGRAPAGADPLKLAPRIRKLFLDYNLTYDTLLETLLEMNVVPFAGFKGECLEIRASKRPGPDVSQLTVLWNNQINPAINLRLLRQAVAKIAPEDIAAPDTYGEKFTGLFTDLFGEALEKCRPDLIRPAVHRKICEIALSRERVLVRWIESYCSYLRVPSFFGSATRLAQYEFILRVASNPPTDHPAPTGPQARE
jgi:hypothetical protein